MTLFWIVLAVSAAAVILWYNWERISDFIGGRP